jgi:hypothetical protein
MLTARNKVKAIYNPRAITDANYAAKRVHKNAAKRVHKNADTYCVQFTANKIGGGVGPSAA